MSSSSPEFRFYRKWHLGALENCVVRCRSLRGCWERRRWKMWQGCQKKKMSKAKDPWSKGIGGHRQSPGRVGQWAWAFCRQGQLALHFLDKNLEKWNSSGRRIRRTQNLNFKQCEILLKVKFCHSNKCYCDGEVELYMETIFESCLRGP